MGQTQPGRSRGHVVKSPAILYLQLYASSARLGPLLPGDLPCGGYPQQGSGNADRLRDRRAGARDPVNGLQQPAASRPRRRARTSGKADEVPVDRTCRAQRDLQRGARRDCYGRLHPVRGIDALHGLRPGDRAGRHCRGCTERGTGEAVQFGPVQSTFRTGA